ncbi:MAG: DNA polymerase III subunit beta [Candidatus Omnitrophica bacterium]|nr:DNA polymerase III subunit beta [Candidatus Omnitrophota bacterium]
MKFKVLKEDFIKGISIIQNAVDLKSTLPILSNILLEIEGKNLRLTTTDLNLGISCILPVETLENGAVAVPAKRFSDIIKELPEQEVNVTAKKNNLVIVETKNCQFKLMGLAREEFPKLPDFKDKEVMEISQEGLKKLLYLVVFAASSDETRYILNGVLFQINKDLLSLVATDGRRLAVATKKLPRALAQNISIIIPIKAVHELIRNLADEGQLSLVLNQNQAMFILGKVIIVSRLLEGEFPDYQAVIPAPSENKIKLDRNQFLQAVRRAAILSTPDFQAVKLEIFKNRIVVSKSTPDVGESREEVSIEYSGKELVVGFNPAYLIDVLKNLEEETVILEVSAADKPAVIRKENYLYIVLPMRLG